MISVWPYQERFTEVSETRTVFVTGGSRGIGLATVRTLLATGYSVVVVSRYSTPELKRLEVSAEGRLRSMGADLTTDSGCRDVASSIRTCTDLYALINNAGMATSGLHVGVRPAEMTQTWRLNVLAPLLLCQAAAKAMCRLRDGRIVNISSIAAHRPYRGLAVYTATKTAIEGFSRVLATEVGPWNITVNCVAPGFVDTQMTAGMSAELKARIVSRTALGSPPQVEDVAEVIKFLLSPAAGKMTGQIVRIDAGTAM